jgi:hypothetical protein
MTENLERQILEIIASDRIDIPISSMSSKLKRSKKKKMKTTLLQLKILLFKYRQMVKSLKMFNLFQHKIEV